MNPIRKIVLAAALLACCAGSAWAGTSSRLGTGGGVEMRLPVGARSVAMGYANAAMVEGAEALFYNPAGLAATDKNTEVLVSYSRWIADQDLNYVAIAQKMGGLGSLGFTAKVLSVGDIVYTTEIAPDGTGEVFSPTFATLGLTYAKQLTDRVNFGTTVQYVSERVLQTSSTAIAFNFGFQYETGVRGIRLGAAMNNFGASPNFSGDDFDRNQQLDGDDPQSAPHTVALGSSEYELPSLFIGSVSYPVLQGVNNLSLHGLYQSNSFDVDEFRFGAEYAWRQDVSLRAGYKLISNDDDLFGFSYGLGLRVPLGGSSMFVDYAGQQVSDFFDDVQHISLAFKF